MISIEMISIEDKFKTILYIRSSYKHQPKNSNKEIDFVYLTIFIVGYF